MQRKRIEEPVDRTMEVHRETAAVWVRYGTDKVLMEMTYAQYMASGKALSDQNQLTSDKKQAWRDEEVKLDDNQLKTQSDTRLVHAALEALEGPLSPLVQDLPPLSDHHGEESGTGGGGATPVTG